MCPTSNGQLITVTNNYSVGEDCSGGGQLCDAIDYIDATTQSTLAVQYTASSGHCSDVRMHFLLAGVEVAESSFLAPGESSDWLDLGSVTPGSYTLGFQAEGQTGGCNDGAILSWAGTIDVVTTAVTNSSTVSGQVTSACDSSPIAGALIQSGTYAFTTDSEGDYGITVPPGTYTVSVSATNYITFTTSVVILPSTSNLTVDVSLSPLFGCSATVTGQVCCSCDTNPIPGALVTIGDYSTNTDSGGNYSFNNVPPGTYNATVSAANYVTTNTSITIASASSTQPSNFTLTPNGADIGTLNAIASASAVTKIVINKSSIQATFTPGIAGLTVQEAACRLGYSHFNWYQEAMSASYQGIMDCGANPWFNDPPAYYCDPDPPYNDGRYQISITINGSTHTEYADALPFYYNEHTVGTWDITDSSHYSSDKTQLYFKDSPSVSPLAIVNPSYAAYFVTSLVGIKADGTYDVLPGTFIWTSDFSGMFGGVTIICASDLDMTNGTGGIISISTNIPPSSIPSQVAASIAQSGGSFPVTIQPGAETIVTGANLTFSISPTNSSSPVNYQWRFNGTNISGATNLTLRLADVTTNSTGIYDAILSNTNGSIGSAPATLTVVNVPLFQLPVLTTNGQIILSWMAPQGNSYQLQYTTSLSQPNWINIGGLVTGSNTLMSTTTAIGPDKQRFYRVQEQ